MKIVIVGGGTAGWLSALFFAKIFPNVHDITVIESSKIGIIGTGEGSTGLLNGIINNQIANFGCNEQDFFKETSSTIKLGIRYQDWIAPGSTYVQPIDGSYTANQVPDSYFLFSMLKDGKFKGKTHTMTPLGYLLEEKKSTFFKDGVNNLGLHGYHFDGHLVGKYFKKISSTSGVKHIDSEVTNVSLKENGCIQSVTLTDGSEIAADFFVDASGFNQVLTKALGIKWVSYQKHLPVNTAMPFQIKYKDNEQIEPSTLANAQSHGWMWRIPVADRYGAGYVFSDNHTTVDKAQAEIEQTLGHSIDPIRIIKFDSGRLEKFWHKNCLAVGLSSAFLEPLEATSIHTTLIQLWWFVKEFSKPTFDDTYSETAEKLYNKRVVQTFEDIKDFLVMHYQTGRTDTAFWKYVNSNEAQTEFTKDITEICKTRSPRSSDFNQYLGSLDWTLWSHVLAGVGKLTPDIAAKDLTWFGEMRNAMNMHTQHEVNHFGLAQQLLSNTEFIKRFSPSVLGP
jgi:hypothetical protein